MKRSGWRKRSSTPRRIFAAAWRFTRPSASSANALRVLIHPAPDAGEALSEAEVAELTSQYLGYIDEQRLKGRFMASVRLLEPRRSVVVRKRAAGEKAVVTDGPFVETKELLAGLFVMDCADLAEAQRLAAELPAARRGGAVEVRPVFDLAAAVRSA